MLRKISSINFIVKEIRYHEFCRTEYQTRARKTPKEVQEEMNQKERVETNWHREREREREREVYLRALESIKEFVQINITDM